MGKKIFCKDIQAALEALAKGNFTEGVIHKTLLLKGEEQEQLFKLSREKRDQCFPYREIETRSVIEISNVCQQNCNFCNINSHSREKRYTIGYDELLRIVEDVYQKGRRVLLIQSGENSSQKYIDFIDKCVKGIKQKFSDLSIILCLGNLTYNQYRQLREAGAERYILKFETSNPVLYHQVKPGDSLSRRIECLSQLIELGFEVGSGNIVGLPNQTIEDIVKDLFFFSQFKLTMASSSVFIPGEHSKYRDKPQGDLNLTLNFMALMRMLYPQMLIPSTSSLQKARDGGQYLGLVAGANVVTIHDGTPEELKRHFPIYSIKRFTPNEEYINGIVLKSRFIIS